MVWVKVASMGSVAGIGLLLDLLRKSDFVSGADPGSLHHSGGYPDCKNPRATVRAQSSAVYGLWETTGPANYSLRNT